MSAREQTGGVLQRLTQGASAVEAQQTPGKHDADMTQSDELQPLRLLQRYGPAGDIPWRRCKEGGAAGERRFQLFLVGLKCADIRGLRVQLRNAMQCARFDTAFIKVGYAREMWCSMGRGAAD